MGLDMYLLRKKRFSTNYDSSDVKLIVDGNEINTSEATVSVTTTVGYWRKANHIHRWFVDNVQVGEDDNQTHHVEWEQLDELLNVCKLVKDNPSLAKEMLPTKVGFFFGSTDYDDGYMKDIDDTIAIIEKAKQDMVSDIYYMSWW